MFCLFTLFFSFFSSKSDRTGADILGGFDFLDGDFGARAFLVGALLFSFTEDCVDPKSRDDRRGCGCWLEPGEGVMLLLLLLDFRGFSLLAILMIWKKARMK